MSTGRLLVLCFARTRRKEKRRELSEEGCVGRRHWHLSSPRRRWRCSSSSTAAAAPCTRLATSTPGASRRRPSPTSTRAGPNPSTSRSATPSVSTGSSRLEASSFSYVCTYQPKFKFSTSDLELILRIFSSKFIFQTLFLADYKNFTLKLFFVCKYAVTHLLHWV